MNELVNNMILKGRVGSMLYGTNTPSSDEDFSGIFLSDENGYLGLSSASEIDLSVTSKNENNKNNSDAVDFKLYELRKFVKLAIQNNPNITELLFLNGQNIIFINEYGTEILSNAHLFPSRRAYEPFRKFAQSQRHKMVIKEKHFEQLSSAHHFFTQKFESDFDPHVMLVEIRPELEKIAVETSTHFAMGDLNFEKHLTVKKVKVILEDRMSKISNRYELVLKHGYDTKFSSHWIRLLQEGIDILSTGRLEFPLKNRELILDIKLGKYHIDEVVKMGDALLLNLESVFENSKLPDTPYIDDINKLVVNIGKRHLKKYE